MVMKAKMKKREKNHIRNKRLNYMVPKGECIQMKT